MIKPMPITQAGAEAMFQLQSIDRSVTPEGSDGLWYRYVIVQGTNVITGMRCGSAQAEVQVRLEDMVQRLNERSARKAPPRIKTPARGAKKKVSIVAGAGVTAGIALNDMAPISAVA